jgi:hypothetical protein
MARWCGSNLGWNFFDLLFEPNPGEVGDTGVKGGEEDDSEDREDENAAEEVVDDVEEIDPELLCDALLFTGVPYTGGVKETGDNGDLLPVVDTGMREIPNSFRLPRPFRRLGVVPFALSKSAPDQIDGMAVVEWITRGLDGWGCWLAFDFPRVKRTILEPEEEVLLVVEEPDSARGWRNEVQKVFDFPFVEETFDGLDDDGCRERLETEELNPKDEGTRTPILPILPILLPLPLTLTLASRLLLTRWDGRLDELTFKKLVDTSGK